MKIDAHQHFWALARGDYDWLSEDLTPIYRDFQPADMRPILDKAGIGGTILVQAAATEAETAYMLSLADAHDWILGVVGWVDMEAASAVDSITQFAKNPKFMGLRPMIQDIDDPDWMLRAGIAPAVEALIDQGLTFDALTLPKHLDNLHVFLGRYPGLQVVIDHCSKPEIRNGGFEPWATQIAKIADDYNVLCKLSGLVTEAAPGWNDGDILPYARHIISSFGPERVMFGSDWPVVRLASDYENWLRIAQLACADLSDPERDAIFGGTAAQFYKREPIGG